MDAFYGEIRIFGFNFPPLNWAQCNGQTLMVSQFQTLFTILGANFGGNGLNNFQLPNLQGSAVCQAGQGPGLSDRTFGKTFGTSVVTLVTQNMPYHQHTLSATNQSLAQATNTPTSVSRLGRTLKQLDFSSTDTVDSQMAVQMVGPFVGQGLPHENRQPYLVMNFCICTYGEYPVRA